MKRLLEIEEISDFKNPDKTDDCENVIICANNIEEDEFRTICHCYETKKCIGCIFLKTPQIHGFGK